MMQPQPPHCPGVPARAPAHPMDHEQLKYTDSYAARSDTGTRPMRVLYCAFCGHVFSVAPPPA